VLDIESVLVLLQFDLAEQLTGQSVVVHFVGPLGVSGDVRHKVTQCLTVVPHVLKEILHFLRVDCARIVFVDLLVN